MGKARETYKIEHIRKNADKSNAELAEELNTTINAIKQYKKKYKIYKKHKGNTAY